MHHDVTRRGHEREVRPPREWSREREAVETTLRAAHVVTAPTRWMLEGLVRQHGPFGAALVLPEGRRPADHPPALAKEPLVVRATDHAWDATDGVDVLERAAPRTRFPSRDWRVVVAGETRAPDQADAPRRLGWSAGNVLYVGPLEPRDRASLLARASLSALPARREPSGSSVLEAALAGAAVVLGDVPSLRETWDGAATSVSPADVEALADALARLSHEGDSRRRLATLARALALRSAPERMAFEAVAAHREARLRASPDAARREAVLRRPGHRAGPSVRSIGSRRGQLR